MNDPVTATSDSFSKALQSISPRWTERLRATRHLLPKADPLTQLAQSGLLRETVVKYLEKNPLPKAPLIVFMDRSGGGEGAKAAGTVIELLAKQCDSAGFVHISFATPPRGLGTLLRSNLARKGSDAGVLVNVISHNVPPEGLKMSQSDADNLFKDCDLAISFASNGAAGITLGNDETDRDALLARSHICVLSFPDPEYAVADLKTYEQALPSLAGIDAIRYWVQQKHGRTFEDLGHCTLGQNGDAQSRLWVLLDNAKRGLYRILMEPMRNGLPTGDPVAAPCKTLIEETLSHDAQMLRFVPAGNIIIAACQGKTV